MSLGSPKAPIHVVEYASLSCPHCAAVHEKVFPAFKAKYIDTGKVRFTLREVLTEPREVAAAGFMLARCAGPSKYFQVVGGVFRNQGLWQLGLPPVRVLTSVGREAGLSENQVRACLSDPARRQATDERDARAMADGISGTPTFMVNGKVVATGEVTLSQLDAAIAAAARK